MGGTICFETAILYKLFWRNINAIKLRLDFGGGFEAQNEFHFDANLEPSIW